MSEQSNSIALIPLNKLSASKLNARKTNRKADIEALAASIAAHGLLQNLSVIEGAPGRYEVIAGARRLAALKSLAASGAVARDFAVPCHVLAAGEAGEASLAENIQRVAMDAMDEVEAFAVLADAGASHEDIARRFGCGARHVEQRLALARLSPKLKSAYRRGDLSLDAARAFCLVDDHAKQEDVFKALGRHVTHAPSVRNHLMQGAMRANDRLARFVGLEAYEAAGGQVTRDLFHDEEAYIDDPALLTRLAGERLEAVRGDLLGKGWGWVNINLGFNRYDGVSTERLQPAKRAMTEDERAALAALDAEVDALDEALEDAEDDDARWDQRDTLAARRYGLLDALQVFDPELMKLAGVVISVDHDGAPHCTYGVVAKDDVAKLRRLRNARAAKTEGDGGAGSAVRCDGRDGSDEQIPPWEESISALPKVLTRELSALRSRVLRWKISEQPDLALAVAVFALSRRTLAGYPAVGFDLDIRASRDHDHDSLEDARGALGEIIPADASAALHWLLAQPRQTLLECLAVLTAGAIDLAHEGVSRDDARKQSYGDILAGALDLDMSAHWAPDAAFLSRLSKSALIDILLASPANGDLTERQRAAIQKAEGKRTKDDLVSVVAKALDGAGWLPDILITPKPAGAFEITVAGCEAIAAE